MTCAYCQRDNSKCQFEHQEQYHYNRPAIIEGERWCHFHAPLEDKNGNPTSKGKWIPDEIRRFYKGISELRENAIAKQEKLDLRGVVFPGNADFHGMEFPEVDFSLAKFEGEADFSGAIFKNKANFRYVHFAGASTNFNNTRFIAEADFRNTRFKGGDTDFNKAKFNQNTRFESALFSSESTSFFQVEFQGDANFRASQFSGIITKFQDAQFSKNAIFYKTVFKGGEVDFLKVEFRGQNTNFLDAAFKGGAKFQDVLFNSLATSFQNALFNEYANFHNAKFIDGEAIFKKAEFSSAAIFQNAQFTGNVNFVKARFKNKADFEITNSINDADAFHGEVDFSGAELLGEASFNNRKFHQATEFRECTFHKAPRFHNCNLHQETDFTDARFLDTTSPGSAMAYRTLKQDMEEKRARQEQLVFYALEMKSRQRTTKKKLLKFLSSLYGMTADYGQSVSRPLLWLGYSYLIFATIYTIFFNELLKEHLINSDNLHLFFSFSLEQIVRPFGALDSSSLSELLEKVCPPNLLLLRLIGTFQSLLSLVLLLLFGLAVRWRFKIG